MASANEKLVLSLDASASLGPGVFNDQVLLKKYCNISKIFQKNINVSKIL